MELHTQWPKIKKFFEKTFYSSFHYAIATVDKDGFPHVSPIGSLMLTETGKGLYFEKFTKKIPENLTQNQKICVMAIDTNRFFLLWSFITGRFAHPPAIRLTGLAGKRRPPTEAELKKFYRRVRHLKFYKGHHLLWQNMPIVRDICFDRMELVKIGAMTEGISL